MFLGKQELQAYVDTEKLTLLETMGERAKEAALSSRHLYKRFNGLYAVGNLNLLAQPKVAIIGTRKPNQYARQLAATLAQSLSQAGFVIVSGGAIGIDCIAQSNSVRNILVSPAGLNRIYPKENAKLFESIRANGLLLSEYEGESMPYAHSFLERNRIIIALSDIVIIPQADQKSGSSSSANLCVALQKELFVLPHRLHESLGTQELLAQNRAHAIYDVAQFVGMLCSRFEIHKEVVSEDALLAFASKQGLFSDALQLFGDKVFEYELEGKIQRDGLYIRLCL